MPIDTFVAGAYSTTWNGVAVGLTANGITVTEEIGSEDIVGDYFGSSVIDSIITGANVFAEFDCLAYKAGSVAAARGFFTGGEVPAPGLLASNLAKSLILTATAGTPAAAAPASLTAAKGLTANGHRIALMFSHRLRQVPVRQRFYPYLDSVYKHFVMG
jgi:hypothetical protein